MLIRGSINRTEHTRFTQMCMKRLQYPFGPSIVCRKMRSKVGNGGEWGTHHVICNHCYFQSLALPSPSLFFTILEPQPSVCEWSQRSIFWMGLLLIYDCVCLCCGGRRENGFSYQIISPVGCAWSLNSPPLPCPPFLPSTSSLDIHSPTLALGSQCQ